MNEKLPCASFFGDATGYGIGLSPLVIVKREIVEQEDCLSIGLLRDMGEFHPYIERGSLTCSRDFATSARVSASAREAGKPKVAQAHMRLFEHPAIVWFESYQRTAGSEYADSFGGSTRNVTAPHQGILEEDSVK